MIPTVDAGWGYRYTGSTPAEKNLFGKYIKTELLSSTHSTGSESSYEFTGSRAGAHGIMTTAATTAGSASLAGGGIVNLVDFSDGIIHEFGIHKISGLDGTAQVFYVLKQ